MAFRFIDSKLVCWWVYRFWRRELGKFVGKLRYRYKSAKKNSPTEHGKDSATVLFASSIQGNSTIFNFEALLKKMLVDRNHKVVELMCDGTLPACFECNYFSAPNLDKGKPKAFCTGCNPKKSIPKISNLKVDKIYFSEYEDRDFKIYDLIQGLSNVATIRKFKIDGICLGEHAYAATLRFFAIGNLIDSYRHLQVLKSFLQSAYKTMYLAEELIKNYHFDVVIMIHGLYVPHGVLNDVFNKHGVRTVVWNLGYRSNTYIFSHVETYHHSLLNEGPEKFLNIDLNSDRENRILKYLDSRKFGKGDWISFVGRPVFGGGVLNGLDKDRPKFLLLTNVAWDAQIHFKQNAFESMWDWICLTIEWFSTHLDLDLIIRVHPAEVNSVYPSQEFVADKIKKHFPNLTNNIYIIDSRNPQSTYELVELVDVLLIYGTKLGVEVAHKGKPIIAAGEAWIRNKGLSIDCSSKEDYLQWLFFFSIKQNHLNYNFATYDNSLKYAYYYFFQRLLELDFSAKGDPELLKNNLGVVIDGIIKGTDFRNNI
jgi:hypothetical protein